MLKIARYLVITIFITIMGIAALGVSGNLLPLGYKAHFETIAPSEPTGGSAAKPPPLPQAKVEIPGVFSIAISEENSWATVAKLMVIILGTFLGMRAINAVFARLAPTS